MLGAGSPTGQPERAINPGCHSCIAQQIVPEITDLRYPMD
jgi:hypothetical protein